MYFFHAEKKKRSLSVHVFLTKHCTFWHILIFTSLILQTQILCNVKNPKNGTVTTVRVKETELHTERY